MAKRAIITIDGSKCDGCGLCIPNCPEGAIQLIDGKARLVSDLFCDGLGACIGHCPKGAITIEQREAEPYDEKKVMGNVAKHGKNVIKAHLKHLKDHGEETYLKEALNFLEESGVDIPEYVEDECQCSSDAEQFAGCPGSKVMDLRTSEASGDIEEEGKRRSELKQWPVQLHLAPPGASFFKGQDVLIAADCVAYTLADFHKDYLKGKALVIACPKLDSEQEVYTQKITAMIDEAEINTLIVMMMEVPCCAGLPAIVKKGMAASGKTVPVSEITISVRGRILETLEAPATAVG